MPPSIPPLLLDDWRIDIARDDTLPLPTQPYYEATPVFQDDMCHLTAPGFQGVIDLQRQRARLVAHPAATSADFLYFQRVVMALVLFRQGNLMVHAAGILHKKGVLLFVGHSGAGKSTLARHAGDYPVLHDDLLALYAQNGRTFVSALPLAGTAPPSRHPLAGLFLLAHAPKPFLQPVPRAIALAELVANSPVVNAAPQHLPTLFRFWRSLLATTPVHRLHFRPDSSFWEVLHARLG
jgi:hypothetical protein